jgi:hypothetical protein
MIEGSDTNRGRNPQDRRSSNNFEPLGDSSEKPDTTRTNGVDCLQSAPWYLGVYLGGTGAFGLWIDLLGFSA